MGVYIYQSGTEKELKNAYIGEYRVPGENTIAYYPLETNAKDYSGKNNDGIATDLTFVSSDSTTVANFGGNSFVLLPAFGDLTDLTVSLWIKTSQGASSEIPLVDITPTTDNKNFQVIVDQGYSKVVMWNGSTASFLNSQIQVNNGNWYHIVATASGTNRKIYVNGELKSSITNSYQISSGAGPYTNLGTTASFYRWYKGYMSDVILENVARTAEEVANYYNSTKSDYGL